MTIVIRFNQTEIEISSGVLFKNDKPCYDGYNVISVSDVFNTEMGKYVSKNSTHYKFIKEIVGKDAEMFKREINESLSSKIPKNPYDEPKRYQLGTTAIARFGNDKYIFIAIVEKDEEYRCIPTSIQDFLNVLDELWKTVRLENDGFVVNMTLIGSGVSNVPMSPYHILQAILMSLYYASQNNVVVRKLRIIIDEKTIRKIDLNNIKSFWSVTSQMKHSDS